VGTLEQAARAALAPRSKDERRNRAADERDTNMKLLAAVCAALGLDADTSEADTVEAFQGATSAILAASGAKKLGKVAAAIEALTENRDALAEKAARVDALSAELAAIKAEKAEGEKVAAVERILAAASNKVSPAKRQALAEKGLRNGAEWLQSVVDELPVLIGSEPPKPADQSPQPASSDELKPREVAMCAQLGIDPKTYAAQKAALLKKAG
jgi:hypothetical protein